MQTTKQDAYARLKDHLATWHRTSNTNQADDATRQYFAVVAQKTLLPELRKLAQILEEGGLQCEVLSDEEDTIGVGLRVDTLSAVLRLSPAHQPSCVQALIAGGGRPNDDLEWLIPYHQIHNGGLERELQAAIVRLLQCSAPAPSHHVS